MTTSQSRRGAAGLNRVRQHCRRHFRTRRAVPAPRHQGPGSYLATARPIQPGTVLHHTQLQRRRPAARRLLGGNGYSMLRHIELLGAAKPVRLSGQPATDERPRRSRGPAGLLAAHHPGPVAGAVSGDGHRCLRSPPTTTSRSAHRGQANTCGAAKWGRTRSTHENHRYRDQARRLLVGAAVVHRSSSWCSVSCGSTAPPGIRRSSAMPADCAPAQFVRASGVEVGKVVEVEPIDGAPARPRRLQRRPVIAAVPGDDGLHPVPELDRRPLPGAQARRHR